MDFCESNFVNGTKTFRRARNGRKMFRRSQNEDETEILAAPSDEFLTVTQNDDNITLSQQPQVRCLAQREKLSEGRYLLKQRLSLKVK